MSILSVGNIIKMSTATTGTGTVTLGSAVSGFVSFATAGIADGSVVSYTIIDGTDKEVGYGTYTSSGTTLTRTLVLSTTGSLLNLSGSATVEVVLAAEDIVRAPLTPGGRLTLSSNTPVMTTDVTAAGTYYYTPYVHAYASLYYGAKWRARSFSQLTGTLNSTDNTSGNIYDVFLVDDSGTLKIGTGPAWSSATSRGTGANTTEIALLNGLWTNANSISIRNNGSAIATFGVGQALYLGSIYCTANGQTGMAFAPSAASGGTNNILGLCNAYNRVRIDALCRDSEGGTDYTYNSTTWRKANNNDANRISWVDGLQQSVVKCINEHSVYNNGVAGIAAIGTSLDSTSAAPGKTGACGSTSTTAINIGAISVAEEFFPQLGFHFVQRMEVASLGTITFAGSTTSPTRQGNGLIVTLEM